jgi:hypothetical protein
LALSFFEQDYLKYVVFLLLFCCPQYLPVASAHKACFLEAASSCLLATVCGSRLLPAVSLWQLPATTCQL